MFVRKQIAGGKRQLIEILDRRSFVELERWSGIRRAGFKPGSAAGAPAMGDVGDREVGFAMDHHIGCTSLQQRFQYTMVSYQSLSCYSRGRVSATKFSEEQGVLLQGWERHGSHHEVPMVAFQSRINTGCVQTQRVGVDQIDRFARLTQSGSHDGQVQGGQQHTLAAVEAKTPCHTATDRTN